MAKLVNGPAAATSASAYRPRMRVGSIGIEPQAMPDSSMTTIEIGPMCTSGLRVMRPCSIGVSSPRRTAIRPWASSWRQMLTTIAITVAR